VLQAFGIVFAKDLPPGFKPLAEHAPVPVLKLRPGKTMGAAAIRTNAVGSYAPPMGGLTGSPSSGPSPAKDINLESVLQAYLDALVQGAYGPLPGEGVPGGYYSPPPAGAYSPPQPGGYAPPPGQGASSPPPPAAREERVCHWPSPPPPPSHQQYTQQTARLHVRRAVSLPVIPQYHLSAVGL
jgi:hypothetical protein